MSGQNRQRWLTLALSLADAARHQTVPRFRSGLVVDNKHQQGRFDPVTEGDREAERVMRELLAREAPTHGVVGEEHENTVGNGRYTWVLDPIDGTRAFVAGFPTWVTLIGLVDEGEPVLGVVDAPASDDRWFGVVGAGAWWSGRDRTRSAIGVRACAGLSSAILSTTTPELFTSPRDQDRWRDLCAATRLRRYGGDGYAYALLAAGHIDLVVERGLASYDVVAPIALVRAAGGIATSWDGGPAAAGGTLVAAGDPRVHEEALALLT